MTLLPRLFSVLGFGLLAASWQAIAYGPAAASNDPLRRVDSISELFGFADIRIATNRTSVEIGPDSYAIAADTQSTGLAGVFFDLRTHSEAQGRIVRGQLRPLSYRSELHRYGTDLATRVEHRNDGSVTAGANPPDAALNADPAAIARTTDQLTAFLSVERKVAFGRSCAGDIPVFDGRHLYTLHFRDAGSQALEPAHAAGFDEVIRICRMQREAIAGFAEAAGHVDGVYAAVIYYATSPGDALAIPVRMGLQTEFGPVTTRLATLRVNGSERHVPE